MPEKRVYEVVYIVDPDTSDEDFKRLTENLENVVAEQGGSVTKSENMGRRQLAYRIGRHDDGVFMLLEVEGSGSEIAELERRMRVSDQVMRYLTVRVDEDRRRAEKLKSRRSRKASKRPFAGSATPGGANADSDEKRA